MKKLLFVLALGCVCAVASTSCKAHESCPAYGANDIETSTEAQITS